MRILFLNAYFYPERIAFSHLEQDIMEGLVKAGHQLTVVCPTPSRGVSKEEIEQYKTVKHETVNSVEVFRYSAPCEGKNPVIRAFRYFWCNFRGNRIGRRFRDTDVIFAVSTPPTQGYFAGKLAKKLGVPPVYSLQDVFPDSLVTSGLAKKNSLLYKLGARIEKKTYARCKRIIVLSDTVRRNLLNKGVEESKLVTVNNWIDTDAVRPVERSENRLFDEYNVSRGDFIVVYAGNFGASQGADIILKAAELLRDKEHIRFVIFGGGAGFEAARQEADDKRLVNVTVHPLLPADRISEAYSMGDVALITCKKGVGKTAMPSKTWSIMACDTPIIASYDTDSELADILTRSGVGVCVEPEDPEALAGAVREAYQKHCAQEQTRESVSPRDYIVKTGAKSVGVSQYVTVIESAVSSS